MLTNLTRVIKGCIDMDAKYQQMLYNQYKGFACKVVFRYIYRYEKAMDVVTDGFVKAFLGFGNFSFNTEADAEKQLLGWLKRIMINCAIDELRKSNMIPEIGEIPDELWQKGIKSDEADQDLLYKDLMKAVRALPTNYRVIFNMHVLDGYSHSQIADRLKISVSTSRSGLTRAKAILQSSITKMEEAKACSI